MTQRTFSIQPKTYQHGYHGTFNSDAHYQNLSEEALKRKNRKDWLSKCIERYSKDPNIKCFSYNHHTQAAHLHSQYELSSSMNIDTFQEKECHRGKDGDASTRHSWHTFVLFD